MNIELLEEVAVACGRLVAHGHLRTGMKIRRKRAPVGADFTTRWDRESQRLALKMLRAQFPEEIVIAEEHARHDSSLLKNCTVLDPLDGTMSFRNGLNAYGVSICTIRDGRPFLSATYFPTDKKLITALRGKGCFVGGYKNGCGLRINRISQPRDLSKKPVGIDVGPWINLRLFRKVIAPISRRFGIISHICATEQARQVLLGRTSAYIGFAKIWDAAGMSLAIEEAGGVALDLEGQPLKWNRINFRWIVASSQKTADIILRHTNHS